MAQPRLHGDVLAARAREMGGALVHRGPDDAGTWVDAQAGIALAHQRLSILDLSPLGHQPMESADGRYVLAYNGEVYNFAPLRAALAAVGHRFRGHSDTEVLLAAVAEWGIEDALQRCNGMFAIALWDRRERCLWLARDRVGKKPLYYGWAGDALVFGSELKALWRHAPAQGAGHGHRHRAGAAHRPRPAGAGRQHRHLFLRRRIGQPRHRADRIQRRGLDRLPEAAGAGAVRVRGQRHRHLGEDP